MSDIKVLAVTPRQLHWMLGIYGEHNRKKAAERKIAADFEEAVNEQALRQRQLRRAELRDSEPSDD